ncbi:MAG TPA: hypothetical protein VMN60_13665 [Longimicrobiales bacterium]|nr:hypothetical protein [Longimicrobiales bacterium]
MTGRGTSRARTAACVASRRGPPARRLRRVQPLLLLCLLAGCGYFNSLYNAKRSFAVAQRAAARGDALAARRSYTESIEKAAVSYRRYPDGRWADDALLLITRAHFALDNDRATAAAAARLLQFAAAPDVRAAAHAYRGAALFRLADIAGAQLHLDSAVLSPSAADTEAFARLWRARVAFRQGRNADGWADLNRAGSSDDIVFEASLDAATHALDARDSVRLADALDRLAGTRFSGQSTAPVIALLERVAHAWSPSLAFSASAPLDDAAWRSDLVDEVALARARLALAAADSAAALQLADRVAQSVAGGIGSTARLFAARVRLAQLDDPAALEQIRELLLPAFDDQQALGLMRRVKATQILVARGEAGSALSLFAAAEQARDELHAPRLSRHLFMLFVQRDEQNVWAGKALLAAHLLEQTAESRAALHHLRDNSYIRAAHGAEVAELTLAEERLARGLAGIRADALTEAVQRDVVVGRALTLLDSTRQIARLDSLRITCGTFVDSLQLVGIRADSVRSACLRGDSARVAWVLKVDTTALRDTVAPVALRTSRTQRAP